MFGRKRRPIMQRLKETAYLFKYSFTIIGKEKDIKTPAIHMAVLSAIIVTVLFASILSFFSPLGALPGILGILLFLCLLVFKRFYVVRQKADMSWLVYNTLTGRDITYADAHTHTKQNKGTLRVMAIVELLVDSLTSGDEEKKGIFSMIKQVLLKALEEVWDLLSHFMIPAVTIENKHFKEIVTDLKSLRNNVPATLAGVFGIDFAGDVVRTILAPIYLLFLAISVGIGYLVALFTESTVIPLGDFAFSWVPVVVMLFIIMVLGGVVKVLVEGIKTIYFTIFYTAIQRPRDIQESMRDTITNYLLLKEADQGQGAGQGTQQASGPQEQAQNQPRQNTGGQTNQHNQYIQNLANYIYTTLQSGYSEQQVTNGLLSKGYQQSTVREAVEYVHRYMR